MNDVWPCLAAHLVLGWPVGPAVQSLAAGDSLTLVSFHCLRRRRYIYWTAVSGCRRFTCSGVEIQVTVIPPCHPCIAFSRLPSSPFSPVICSASRPLPFENGLDGPSARPSIRRYRRRNDTLPPQSAPPSVLWD
jgi:hypothetical protein